MADEPTDEPIEDEHVAEEPIDDGTAEAVDPDAEWTAAGEEIRNLGAQFKKHYDEPVDDEDPAPSTDELKEAARAFGRSFGRLVGALGDAARDPEVKESARRAGSKVIDAFGTTFTQLGREAKEAFDGRGAGEDATADEPDLEAATRELDDADLLDELKADLAEDEGGTG
jgi:hypothetical protein